MFSTGRIPQGRGPTTAYCIESPGISVFPAKLEVFQLMTKNDNLRENSQNKVLLNCYFATLIFFAIFAVQDFHAI